MAKKEIVTEQAVADAVDLLVLQGRQPTDRAVREVLGGGSPNKINQELKKRKEILELKDTLSVAVERAKPLAEELVLRVFGLLKDEADEHIWAIERTYVSRLLESSAALEESAAEGGKLADELDQRNLRIKELEVAVASAKSAAERSEALADDRAARLNESQREIERLREALQQANQDSAEARGRAGELTNQLGEARAEVAAIRQLLDERDRIEAASTEKAAD